jgi:hypothetical protein
MGWRCRKVSWAAAACLALAGCSGGVPSITVNTAHSQTPIYTPPAPPSSGGLAAPPQNGQAAVPDAYTPTDRSGTYEGVAMPLDTGGGICIKNRKVTGFKVNGRSVRFGSFRGSIDGNGGVQMFAGQHWIVGQFEGAYFAGQLDMTARGMSGGGARGCSYTMNLARVGP